MQRHARAAHETATCRVSVHSLAMLVSPADTILVSKLKLACIADAVCTHKSVLRMRTRARCPSYFL